MFIVCSKKSRRAASGDGRDKECVSLFFLFFPGQYGDQSFDASNLNYTHAYGVGAVTAGAYALGGEGMLTYVEGASTTEFGGAGAVAADIAVGTNTSLGSILGTKLIEIPANNK